MTATDRSLFRLTGDSHADLDRMERAFRHDDRMEANACAPGPTGPVAEAQRRARVQLDALATLIGPAALMLLTDAVGDLHYAGADYRARTIMLEETTIRLGNEVDVARNLAARLEEEVARLTDPWIGRYLQALEEAVGEERRELLVAQVNEAWRAAGCPTAQPAADTVTVALPDTGLPVVDDASLAEGELQFRAGATLVAVGRLDRLFAPLDTATEIALGAQQADVPGAEHPLGEGDD